MEQLWTYTHIIQKDPGYFAILNFYKLTILLSVCKHKKDMSYLEYHSSQFSSNAKILLCPIHPSRENYIRYTMLLQVRQLLQH